MQRFLHGGPVRGLQVLDIAFGDTDLPILSAFHETVVASMLTSVPESRRRLSRRSAAGRERSGAQQKLARRRIVFGIARFRPIIGAW